MPAVPGQWKPIFFSAPQDFLNSYISSAFSTHLSEIVDLDRIWIAVCCHSYVCSWHDISHLQGDTSKQSIILGADTAVSAPGLLWPLGECCVSGGLTSPAEGGLLWDVQGGGPTCPAYLLSCLDNHTGKAAVKVNIGTCSGSSGTSPLWIPNNIIKASSLESIWNILQQNHLRLRLYNHPDMAPVSTLIDTDRGNTAQLKLNIFRRIRQCADPTTMPETSRMQSHTDFNFGPLNRNWCS